MNGGKKSERKSRLEEAAADFPPARNGSRLKISNRIEKCRARQREKKEGAKKKEPARRNWSRLKDLENRLTYQLAQEYVVG